MYSFFSRELFLNLLSTNPGARSRGGLFARVLFMLFSNSLFPSLSLFTTERFSSVSSSLYFLLSFVLTGGVKLRNELCSEMYRETTLFFPQGHEKKREIHHNSIIYTFSTVTPRSKCLFFASFVSLFRLTSVSKKQHPESESRERERALLPSLYFPTIIKSHHRKARRLRAKT